MLLLALFAFFAGVVTILSPCILPILPIILAGSVAEGKRRPIGIVAGFIISFSFFTWFLSAIVKATGLHAELLRQVAVAMIVSFGISLVIPGVQKILEQLFTFFSQFAPQKQTGGFWGGLLVGSSLGLIWTPCVGPILASIISLAISGSVSGSSVVITLAYALGTSLPMLGIMLGGRQLLNKLPWVTKNTQKIQQGFGVVMVLVGLAIGLNVDRNFQTWVLTVLPAYGQNLTKFEENKIVKEQLVQLQQVENKNDQIANGAQAPEITGGGTRLNSEPLSLAALRGKVVLVDFWTYTCINCIRTLPHVTGWYEKYKDKDFVIIGVHSPEFAFEQVTANVKAAITEHNITYPVVQDNEFKIWRAYDNHYWPAHYLIDKKGVIRYTHFGEGKYGETENKIRELLDEKPLELTETQKMNGGFGQTPEIYLGLDRAQAYANSNAFKPNMMNELSFTKYLPLNSVDLSGKWLLHGEYIEAQSKNAQLRLNYRAGQVFLVLSPPTDVLMKSDKPANIRVLLDNKPLPNTAMPGGMNTEGEITIRAAKEYTLVNNGSDFSEHILSITFDPGVRAYAFTFGSEDR